MPGTVKAAASLNLPANPEVVTSRANCGRRSKTSDAGRRDREPAVREERQLASVLSLIENAASAWNHSGPIVVLAASV